MKLRHGIGTTLLATFCVAAPLNAQPVRAGAFLVATEGMSDYNFKQSVVLVIHDDENGTLGVLINRPTSLDPADQFSELEYLKGMTGPVYYGGPVAPTRLLLALRNPPADLDTGVPVYTDTVISGDPDVLRGKQAQLPGGGLRVFAGHAEWQPGQLDEEIAAGDWRVVHGRSDLVFTSEPLTLWRRALLLESDDVVDLGPRGPKARAEAQPFAAADATGIASNLAFRYNSVIWPRLAIATALSSAARGSSSMSGISSLTR
jgi:putative transcriptional regulator